MTKSRWIITAVIIPVLAPLVVRVVDQWRTAPLLESPEIKSLNKRVRRIEDRLDRLFLARESEFAVADTEKHLPSETWLAEEHSLSQEADVRCALEKAKAKQAIFQGVYSANDPIRRSSPKLSEEEGKIQIDNSAEFLGRKHFIGKREWEWTIYIVADEEILDDIQCVTYTLHPTFPEPVQTIDERGTIEGKPFALTANGWGTFTVEILIAFTDGSKQRKEHQLVF